MCSSCRRGLSRRDVLRGAALAGVAALAPVRTHRARAADTETVVLTTTVVGVGTYTYLPLEVPPGVAHLHVRAERSADAATGLGIFDPRGPGYQSAGFRGIYGEERREFELSAEHASPSFLPGPITPGTWTLIVPVFQAPQPTEVTIVATMRFGPQRPAPPVVRSRPGTVRAHPGWYRGDLHCHTPESSDAASSGTALDVEAWADECRAIGLDFAAMTDHNVVSQNVDLGRAAGRDVLLMAGEEMTNWFHGHATVSGLHDPVGWLDWRQRPAGIPLQDHERPIRDFLRAAHEQGGFVSAAHPFFANLSWQFFAEAAADPRARTDGIEIWTGQWTPDCEVALAAWDAMLAAGQRTVANGGSDLHGVVNDLGFRAGTPTTVVHAEALESAAVVTALRAGRSFVTRRPDGVDVHLVATGPGEQRQVVGGTVYGDAGTTTEVEVAVRGGAGCVLLVRGSAGVPATVQPLAGDDEVVRVPVPLHDGYVRVEVRRAPELVLDAPLTSDGGMEAFTNPIFLTVGAPPDDHAPLDATGAPWEGRPGEARRGDARPGDARPGGASSGGTAGPGPGATGGGRSASAAPAATATQTAPDAPGAGPLPVTGGAGGARAALGAGALAAAAALRPRRPRAARSAAVDADGHT